MRRLSLFFCKFLAFLVLTSSFLWADWTEYKRLIFFKKVHIDYRQRDWGNASDVEFRFENVGPSRQKIDLSFSYLCRNGRKLVRHTKVEEKIGVVDEGIKIILIREICFQKEGIQSIIVEID